MTLLLEQLDTVEAAKKNIDELKLAKQFKVIELWKTIDQHDTSAQPEPVKQSIDDEELDSNAMIIEVKDNMACDVDE